MMKRKEEKKAKGKGQRAMGGEQSSKFKVQSSKFSEQSAESKVQRASCKGQAASNQQPAAIREFSTVYHIKKPSATVTWFPAEGCISESRAIRACLMIRVFNN